VARKKGASPWPDLTPKNATSPREGESLDEGRSSVREQPNRKGGFYLHRDGSPLGEWVPGNFHCDISAVIEQAPTLLPAFSMILNGQRGQIERYRARAMWVPTSLA